MWASRWTPQQRECECTGRGRTCSPARRSTSCSWASSGAQLLMSKRKRVSVWNESCDCDFLIHSHRHSCPNVFGCFEPGWTLLGCRHVSRCLRMPWTSRAEFCSPQLFCKRIHTNLVCRENLEEPCTFSQPGAPPPTAEPAHAPQPSRLGAPAPHSTRMSCAAFGRFFLLEAGAAPACHPRQAE